ncbi:YbhB/YbcL family Raf kinase inhibitor-like protein [Coralloluteibacterium thermophilus]|uniref:YbhB/YbcL family Raf kinase inhibitor-like protein n=1 Tax=Coralloluteibacterium thermophilum TaxID=2707049 RepID=A0ABV9NIR0_9GAMM
MQLRSNDFDNGGVLAAAFAAGAPDGFGGNRNPHLAWSGAPEGTRSFALVCIDPDAPTDASLAGKEGVAIPVEHVRGEFYHWAVADIPATVTEIPAGSAADGFEKGGKRDPRGPAGARQGLNSYTEWFAGDAGMRGDYLGYDGPYPPPNDLRVHRYIFRVFALDVEKLDLPARFAAPDLLRAIQGHVLAEAAVHGRYSLNPAVDPAG